MGRKQDDRKAVLLGRFRDRRPRTREELRSWVAVHCGVVLPKKGVCAGHCTPLDYLEHTFFERDPLADCIVWANRGGGKTMIGAVATLLDLVFKPPCQVRILGGSLQQSENMFKYLRGMVRETGLFAGDLADDPTCRRIELTNGSSVEVLAQSERSVRGQRVQKLRCDEIELFDRKVWEAAQLTTRSLLATPEDGEAIGASAGEINVRGAVEVFSTMHRPRGLMQELVEGNSARRVFAWCAWDVAACPKEKDCGTCPLWEECRGKAKEAEGFVPVDDLIAMRERVGLEVWRTEMLCHAPVFSDRVFPRYDKHVHEAALPESGRHLRRGESIVVQGRTMTFEALICGVDYGYVHPFVCLWIMMLRDARGNRVVWVIDELMTGKQLLRENAAAMRQRGELMGRPAVVYADAAGRKTDEQTGKTGEAILREAGFRVESRAMGIDEGLRLIGALMDPADVSGGVRFFVDPRCGKLIQALQGYRWSEPDGQGRRRPVKDNVHDDPVDALRYGLMNHDGVDRRVEVGVY